MSMNKKKNGGEATIPKTDQQLQFYGLPSHPSTLYMEYVSASYNFEHKKAFVSLGNNNLLMQS